MQTSQIPKIIWEISCRTHSHHPAAVELLQDLLIQQGIKSEDLVERQDHKGAVILFYLSSAKQTRNFLKKINALKLRGIKF